MSYRHGTYYKCVDPDGWDLSTHTVQYEPGFVYTMITVDPSRRPKLCTGTVLHASPSVFDAIRICHRRRLDTCAHLQLLEVVGQPVIGRYPHDKHGFLELEVVSVIRPARAVRLMTEQQTHAMVLDTRRPRWVSPYALRAVHPLTRKVAVAVADYALRGRTSRAPDVLVKFR